MVPGAEQTAANRQLLAGAVRLVALILLAIAVYMWAYEIEFALTSGLYFPAASQGPLTITAAIWNAMSWAPLVLIVVGAVFLLIPDRIARSLVRLPRATCCPGCGYAIKGLQQPKCPECGLRLSDAFVDAE